MLLGTAFELGAFPTATSTRLRVAVPYVVVAIAFVALFWELLLGRPPASRDHAIHYFQTQLLWSELIPSGRLWGWNSDLGAGYPFGESYPVLGYLLTGLSHALSFGLVDLRTSYAWGIAFTWALGTFAIGWLAHGIVTALPGKREGNAAGWAFCAAGLLWLFDAGASRQGGWNYLLFHGVWPQMFSAVLWTLSLSLSGRAICGPSARRIAAAALVLGASVAAHPFGMLAAAASGGISLVVLLLFRTLGPAPLRTWAWVHGAAIAMSAGVVLVFLGSATGMARSPVQWSPLGQIGYELATGTLFATHWAWLGPLFVLGAIIIVRRPSPAGVLTLLLVATLIVLGSHESMTVLRLDLLVSGFKNLQFPRYTIEFKPLMFAIAGVGAISLPAAVRGVSPKLMSSRGRAWLVAATMAPFVATLVPDLGRFSTRPVGALDTLEAHPEGAHEAELSSALRAQAAALPPDVPLKVAFLRSAMGGGMYPIYSVTDAGGQLVLDGHVAAVNFKHRIRRAAEGYDALGITHVIHDRPVPESDETFNARLRPLGEFGDYTLSRYVPIETMPRATSDHGSVRVVEDATEYVVVEVATDQPTRVVLRQAPHVRWQASFDGEPVEIVPTKRTVGLTLLSVTVPRSGSLEFTYHRKPREVVGGWLSLLACLVGLAALALGRPLRFRDRPSWTRSRLTAVMLVTGLLGLVAAAWMQARKLEQTWQHFAAERAYGTAASPLDDGPASKRAGLVRDLVDDDALELRRRPSRVCNGLGGKDVLEGCSEAEHAPVAATTYREPYLYRCVEFGVPPGGIVEIPLGSGDHDVLGRLQRRLLGSPGRRLKFGAAKAPTQLRTDDVDFFVPRRGDGKPAMAVLINDGRSMERFCLAAAEVEAPR